MINLFKVNPQRPKGVIDFAIHQLSGPLISTLMHATIANYIIGYRSIQDYSWLSPAIPQLEPTQTQNFW